MIRIKWNPEEIDKTFNSLREKLGRNPTFNEFPNGAAKAIIKGRYHPEIKTWNQFLKHKGENLNKVWRRWYNPKNIDNSYDELKEKLGRTPFLNEFSKGAIKSIYAGKYHPNVHTWNQYLIHRGEKLNLEYGKWTPQSIDKTFDELKEKLGRTPKQKEFPKSAINAIRKGRYHPDIKTWDKYLIYMNEELNRQSLKPEEIDEIFKELKEKLGRVPRAKEFPSKVLYYIRKGRYHSDVKTWNQFLKHRGEELKKEPGKWVPENIDKTFDELKEKLGRTPLSRELPWGTKSAIYAGKYHPDIKTWNQYLIHRGEKISRRSPRQTSGQLEILEDLLEDEE